MHVDAFEVSVLPAEPPRIVSHAGAPSEVGRWTLRDVIAGDGYVGAIAVEGDAWMLEDFDWMDDEQPAEPVLSMAA